MIRVLAWAALLALAAEPAYAGPVIAAIGSAISAITSTAVGAFLVRTAVGLALTSLGRSLSRRPARGAGAAPPPQLQITAPAAGEFAYQQVLLGRTATGGAYIHPAYVSGEYLSQPVVLCAVPGASLVRVAIDGNWVTLDTASPHASYGWPAAAGTGYEGYLWVKYYDGTQTAADSYMTSTFGADPVAPWTDEMVGLQTCYAIVTYRKNTSLYAGVPQPIFEMDGVPVYDPRQDDTAGGAGSQRWDDPATWAYSTNPAVLAYNVLRGITLPGGDVIGGRAEAEDLPYAVWAAAMDVCDEVVDGAARYRAGLALSTGVEPQAAIEALAEAMAGQIVCTPDGRWLVTAGGPGLPVGSVTDADTVAGRVATLVPHVEASQRFYGVQVTHPSPDDLWQARARPSVDAAVIPSGARRRADVTLEAVYDAGQADRIAASWLADHELQRRHVITLPASHGWIDPLDVVTLDSERFGYAGKSFEVSGAVYASDGTVAVTVRETDHAGWA